MDLTREQFDVQRRPRFGTANPERMQLPFWEWMIRGDDSPLADENSLLGRYGLIVRNGVLKSRYGPWRARDLFNIPTNRDDGPIWTFDRMGATRTELPDGRVVCVAGEHEDFYDPDFCIYNDVVVLGPGYAIEIYGYPKDAFPPTDFHSATRVGDRIVLIGRLGYAEERVPGTTPVFALDLRTFRIDPLSSAGDVPGWLFKHNAELDPDGTTLTVRGGKTIEVRDGRQVTRENVETYRYYLDGGQWERLTQRRTRQFLVFRQDECPWFRGAELLRDEVFRPTRVTHEFIGSDGRTRVIKVAGAVLTLEESSFDTRILVLGELPDEVVRQVVEDVQANLTAATGQPCRVLEL
jgi:hypothetical protein